jgi:hypothetical protein
MYRRRGAGLGRVQGDLGVGESGRAEREDSCQGGGHENARAAGDAKRHAK